MSQLLDTARASELAEKQAAELEKSIGKESSSHARVNYAGNSSGSGCSGYKGNYSQHARTSGAKPKSENASNDAARNATVCYHCGGSWPHPCGQTCPARGTTCNNCHKRNHFTQCCRSSKPAKTSVNQVQTETDNKELDNTASPTNALSSDDEEYVFGLNGNSSKLPAVNVMICNQAVKVYIDS